MASNTANPVRSRRKGLRVLTGSVAFGSTGAVGAYSTGAEFTLTRTGTGAYTLTLPEKYHSLVSIVGTVVNSSAEDGHWQRAGALTSNQTVAVLHVAAGSAADPASGTSVDFMIAVKNSGVYP